MRLHLMRKSTGAESYFIVAGSHVDFIQRFRSITTNRPTAKKRVESLGLSEPQGFYTEWFAFKTDEIKTFNLKDGPSNDHSPFYSKFLTDYKPKDIDRKLELPEQITTTCIEITPLLRESPTPYVGGIWKVE